MSLYNTQPRPSCLNDLRHVPTLLSNPKKHIYPCFTGCYANSCGNHGGSWQHILFSAGFVIPLFVLLWRKLWIHWLSFNKSLIPLSIHSLQWLGVTLMLPMALSCIPIVPSYKKTRICSGIFYYNKHLVAATCMSVQTRFMNAKSCFATSCISLLSSDQKWTSEMKRQAADSFSVCFSFIRTWHVWK